MPCAVELAHVDGLLGCQRRSGVDRSPRVASRANRAEGPAALRAWLATPPRTFALESEHLVRTYLAAFGQTEDLVAVLHDAKDRAEQMLAISDRVISAYEAGTIEGPQDEPHLRAVLVDFLAGFAQLTMAWADRSLAEIDLWDDTDPDARRAQAVARLRTMPRRPATE